MATYGPTAPTGDSYLDSNATTTNRSGSTSVVLDGTFSNTLHRAIMQWDVSSIPVGATVSSAILSIRVTNNTSISGTGTFYPVTRAFVMAECAWNLYATASSWTTAGGDYNASFGSQFTFDTTATPFTDDIDVTTAVAKALADYRFSDVIGLLGRRDTEPTNPGQYWFSSNEGANDPTLTVTYTTTTALTVTRADDYDPNQTAVSGTLRWALFNQSGDRTVTVDAAVVTSGIDLDPSITYGPVGIVNTNCAFDGGGVVINEWGITVATPDVQLEDFVLEPNDSEDGRGLVITDGSSQQTLTAITVTGMTVLANGDDPVSVQQQHYGSSITAAFTNITVDAASEDLASSKGLLVSGPSAGAINGTFTYDHYDIGGTEPVSGRIPLVFGGLHTFTDCEFVQGWSTTDIKAAHVNWIRCNWVTRAQPPGATYWYAGRLVMVSFPATTRMYFEDCTLDGVPVTYTSLCKVHSVSGNADIDAGVISGTLLATIPQNPTPTISNLSPSSYFAGGVNNVVITGTGFRPNSTVTVNSVSVPFTLTDNVNGTIITARVPSNVFAAPGTFNVTVSNPAPTGGTSSASSLTVTGLGRRSGGTSCMIATGTI